MQSRAMSCEAVQRHAKLCHETPCKATRCCAKPCQAVQSHSWPCSARPRGAVLSRAAPVGVSVGGSPHADRGRAAPGCLGGAGRCEGGGCWCRGHTWCVCNAQRAHAPQGTAGVCTHMHDHMRVHCCVHVVLHTCTLTHADTHVQHCAMHGLARGHACTLTRAHIGSCALADVHSLLHHHQRARPCTRAYPHTGAPSSHTCGLADMLAHLCTLMHPCMVLHVHVLAHSRARPPAPRGLVRGPVPPSASRPRVQGLVHAQAGVTARVPACPGTGVTPRVPSCPRSTRGPWRVAPCPSVPREHRRCWRHSQLPSVLWGGAA